MDKLDKLQALTSDSDTVDQGPDVENWWSKIKPTHIYEGTDSEDDEIITSRDVHIATHSHDRKGENDLNMKTSVQTDCSESSGPAFFLADDFSSCDLKLGQVVAECVRFCPLHAIRKYPFTYIGGANKQKVAETFFDQGKFFDHTWDLFYLHRSLSDFPDQPILLVPTQQFEKLLETINETLSLNLTLPSTPRGAFEVIFPNDGTPRPRYLGRSSTKEMADRLKKHVPPSSHRIKGERESAKPSDRSLAAFKKKIELINQAAQGKKLENKQKQKAERIAKQQSWGNAIKRVQRYVGLRESQQDPNSVINTGMKNISLDFASWDARAQSTPSQLSQIAFDPTIPAPSIQESDVVFICIDVEAYERDKNKVTEIGVSTLDTRDIARIAPGVGGKNWFQAIRSRHFRIKEYMHLINKDFVAGCADRFEFGTSEIVSLRDAPSFVASCFKPPFSNQNGEGQVAEDQQKRNIVLVGHDVGNDVSFLRSIGYDVYNLSNLLEEVDTASMWRYCTRDSNPRNLGSILAELDILGWNLHNAGNDSTYTLQAMISICVKHLVSKQKTSEVKNREKDKRIADAMQEAASLAVEREQGWSSGESDGGYPVSPKGAASSRNGKKRRPISLHQNLEKPSDRGGQISGPWNGLAMEQEPRGTQIINQQKNRY